MTHITPLQDVTTDRLQRWEKRWVSYTLTRVGADITSSLGMKTTPELCRQKCRYIQASSHNQAGIYIGELGGGRRQYEMVILSSASTVSFRVAVMVIREKAIYILPNSDRLIENMCENVVSRNLVRGTHTKTLKRVFPFTRPMRGVLGEADDGEDRRGAVRAGGAGR